MAPQAYTINEFVEAHGFGRSLLYELWARGEGPQRMKVGHRTLISREAAEDWRRKMTEASERVAKSVRRIEAS